MTGAVALAGRRILVTRPERQAAALMTALREAGAEPVLFPVIEIVALQDTAPLAALAARLPEYDFAFFVSSNAVIHALAVLPRPSWPDRLRIVTVGPGSARALRDQGFEDVLLPVERFDSEGVLELPAFAPDAIAGRRVLLLRGQGGRELLAHTLRERGAIVDVMSCYRRLRAQTDATPVIEAFGTGQLDALSFTSSEGARNFVDSLGTHARTLLETLPCFVPHARIAGALRELGARTVRLSDAGDAGLLAALEDYFR